MQRPYDTTVNEATDMIWFGDKKRLEKKIKDLEYELSVCKADLEEVRFHYYGDEVND